jgi:hypothetical protein
MLELFLSEWRRFRKPALIFAGVHLLAVLALDPLVDFFNTDLTIQGMALTVYLASALLFAVYQFGTLRTPARWIWLLHRPVSSQRIFLALAGAAGCVILLAIGLPLLATAVFLDLFTERLIEWRHYATLAQLLLLAAMVWAAGCHVMLFRNSAGIAILLVLYLLFGRRAALTVLLPLAVACVALLLWFAAGSFRPDRRHDGGSEPYRLAACVPVQVAAYVLLACAASWSFQLVSIMRKTHPNNMETPRRGGLVEATRAEPKQTFQLGLAEANTPEAAQWRTRLEALKPAQVWWPQGARPLRYQWGNKTAPAWSDGQRHIRWTFSHDAMRYAGVDSWTGASRGWLGVAGDAPRLDSPPLAYMQHASQVNRLLTLQHLYAIDAAGRAAHPLVSVSGDETLVHTVSMSGREVGEYQLTSKRLLMFHEPRETSPDAPWRLRASVPLAGPLNDLARVHIAEAPGGALVSMLFGRTTVEGGPDAHQVVYLVDPQGGVRVIAQRTLEHEFPPLFEHLDWWLSPLMFETLQLREYWLENGNPDSPLPAPRPPTIWLAAALASLLSAAGAWLWMSRTRLPLRRKGGWLAACLLIGPSSLLALMALHRRTAAQKQAQALPPALPA